jgi:hypothetical protein
MSRRRKKAQAAKLDTKVVADPEALEDAISEQAERDASYRRASRKIVRLQHGLRELVADPDWDLYLQLEAAVNDRAAALDRDLVRWAFKQGCRRRNRPRSGSGP